MAEDAPKDTAKDVGGMAAELGEGQDAFGQYTAELGTDDDTHSDKQKPVKAPEKIHIIGLGAVGTLVAHALRGIPKNPHLTLITHRRGQMAEWYRSEQQLTIKRDNNLLVERPFSMELALPPLRAYGVEVDDASYIFENPDGLLPHEAAAELKRSRGLEGESKRPDWTQPRALEKDESDEPIECLIVTVKAPLTVSAVSSVRHRLSSTSTLCLLQNGMGVVDELNEHVFPDPDRRPTYILGVVSHGVHRPPDADTFSAVHAGHGTIALTVLPRTARPETDIHAPPPLSVSARYLMRSLTRTPVLQAMSVPHAELLQQKLEKLAVNAVINPVTALLDARNGTLNYNFHLTRVHRLLLAETSLILRALPALRALPGAATRFGPQRLETLTVAVATATAHNVSSMLADVRRGRPTEIGYINGWIVRRGEEQGNSPLCNYLVMNLVKGKAKVVGDEVRDAIPLAVPEDEPAGGWA